MPDNPTTGEGCGAGTASNGWQVNPAGTEGICLAVEALGWELATPHGTLRASADFAAGLFYRDENEQAVASAIQGVWNRVLARNMVYSEVTLNTVLGGVRNALGYLQEANCDMAQRSVNLMFEEPDGRVYDGLGR